jgi:lipopolysaccharide/colanic/teichoic acid biosynthesis glycosyltransferase
MAIAALTLLLPLFLLIAALVKISSEGPLLHRENRVGQDARIFQFLTFRTTKRDDEQNGWPITIDEEEEVTHLGIVLRALKLDGLPQLWNVLRGDMSIVGPRPEIPSYVAAYTRAQLRVLTVMPGITDVASILSRREELVVARAADREDFYRRVVLPEKLLLNLEYLDRVSLPVDMKLIVQSARTMFRPRRVPQPRV